VVSHEHQQRWRSPVLSPISLEQLEPRLLLEAAPLNEVSPLPSLLEQAGTSLPELETGGGPIDPSSLSALVNWLDGTLEDKYTSENTKYLLVVGLSASIGHGLSLANTLVIDLNDYFGQTLEGADGWVTMWSLVGGAVSIGLPFEIGIVEVQFDDGLLPDYGDPDLTGPFGELDAGVTVTAGQELVDWDFTAGQVTNVQLEPVSEIDISAGISGQAQVAKMDVSRQRIHYELLNRFEFLAGKPLCNVYLATQLIGAILSPDPLGEIVTMLRWRPGTAAISDTGPGPDSTRLAGLQFHTDEAEPLATVGVVLTNAFQLSTLFRIQLTTPSGWTLIGIYDGDPERSGVAPSLIDSTNGFWVGGGNCQSLYFAFQAGAFLPEGSAAFELYYYDVLTGWTQADIPVEYRSLEMPLHTSPSYQAVLDAQLGVTLNNDSVELGDSVTLTATVSDGQGAALTGAQIVYQVADAQGRTVASGEAMPQGGGVYQATFYTTFDRVGVYSVNASAAKEGYSAAQSTVQLTVVNTPQVGHDIGVTSVSWLPGGAINPTAEDLHAMLGETITVTQTRVKNFGDVNEVTVPLYMEVRQDGLVQCSSNILYVDRLPGEESWSNQALELDTSGLSDGFYELRVRTALPSDADPTNDSQTWSFVLGNPYPQPGQLPYISYDWYRCQHTGSTPATQVGSIRGYSLQAVYQSEGAVVLRNGGTTLGILNDGDPPTAFDGGKLVAWLEAASYLSGPQRYFIDLQVGAESPYTQSDPMQVVYADPDPSHDELPEIDLIYRAYFDYYLPSFGATSSRALLLGWGPQLNQGQLGAYKRVWTTVDQPGQSGGVVSEFGAALVCSDDEAPGSRDDYYVFCPATDMPEGDYDFLIIQDTNAPNGEGWHQIGFAHSVRVTVVHYRDAGIASIEVPAGAMCSGNESKSIDMAVTITNDSDVALGSLPAILNVRGPCGYNALMRESSGMIEQGSEGVVSFSWDASVVSPGAYSVSAYTVVPGDADSHNNVLLMPFDLLPPAPPSPLQVDMILDRTVYEQNAMIDAEVTVRDESGTPVDGARICWEVRRDGWPVINGQGVTAGAGQFHVPLAPLEIVDDYLLNVRATYLGFRDGQDAKLFTIRDSTPPTDPILLLPLRGAKLVDGKPTFEWLDSIDAYSNVAAYRIEVDDEAGFGIPEIDTTVTEPTYQPQTALPPGEYWWRVRAIDDAAPTTNETPPSDPRSFTVLPENLSPVADPQSVSASEDDAAGVTILLTGSDAETANDDLVFLISQYPGHGDLVDFDPATGGVRYVAALDFNGIDTFAFSVGDTGNPPGTPENVLYSEPATVTIEVAPANDLPSAEAQSVDVQEEGSVLVTLGGSDVETPYTDLAFTIVDWPAHGTLTAVAHGQCLYEPDENHNGPDSFSFTVTDTGDPAGGDQGWGYDGALTSAEGWIDITIGPVNDRPAAEGQSVEVGEDGSVLVTLGGSDLETAYADLLFNVPSRSEHGTLTEIGHGQYRYDPDANYNGPDSFSFTVTDTGDPTGGDQGWGYDGPLESGPATVQITVLPVNDRPSALAQDVSTLEGAPIVVTLDAEDVETGYGSLTFSVPSRSTHGTLTEVAHGQYLYEPDENYNGPDSFSFTVTDTGDPAGGDQGSGYDGALTSAEGWIDIAIGPVNDRPAAEGQSVEVGEDGSVLVTLGGSDLETGYADLFFNVPSRLEHGTLTEIGHGQYRYEPDANYNGPDSFSFTVTDTGEPTGGDQGWGYDGPLESDAVTIAIAVSPVNDKPVGQDQTVTRDGNQPVVIVLEADDVETTYGDLVFNAPAQTAEGGSLIEIGHGHYRYEPDPEYYGPDTFTFTITDTGDPAGGDQGWGFDSARTSDTITVDIDVIERWTRVGQGGLRKFTFPDGNGNSVTIRLAGPGYANVMVANNQTGSAASGDVRKIKLYTTLGSALRIDVAGGACTTVHDIMVEEGFLGSLKAKTTDIVGSGINVTGNGYIASLYIHDTRNGADIIMPGTGAAKGITIKAGQLYPGTDIVLGSYLKRLTATQWVGSSLTAPWASSITIKGDRRTGIAGDLGADLTFTEADPKEGVSLGKLKVYGSARDVTIQADEGIKYIKATEWIDTDGVADRIEAPWLGKFYVKGDSHADLALSGAGADDYTLKYAKVYDDLEGVTWDIDGLMGKLKVYSSARDVTILAEDGIKYIKATEWIDTDGVADRIEAPWLGKFYVKGDSHADLALSGAGGDDYTLKYAKVYDDLEGVTWDIDGLMGKLKVYGSARDVSIQADGGIKYIKATEWIDTDGVADTIEAPWLGKLYAKGKFQGDLALSGAGADDYTLKYAKVYGDLTDSFWGVGGEIGKIRVYGTVADSTIRSTGSIRGIRVGAASGADFLAGVDEAVQRHADDAGDFDVLATIDSFKVRGPKYASPRWFFEDSNVSAARLGSVYLRNAKVDNGGVPFGIWARAIRQALR